jgi:hypothetical protein
MVSNNKAQNDFANKNMFITNEMSRNVRPRSPPVIFYTNSIPNIINVSPAGHYQPIKIKNPLTKIN